MGQDCPEELDVQLDDGLAIITIDRPDILIFEGINVLQPGKLPKDGKIVPFLWFDGQAEEAARLYTSLFPNSRIGTVSRYGTEGFEAHGQPAGRAMVVEMDLDGVESGLDGQPGGVGVGFVPVPRPFARRRPQRFSRAALRRVLGLSCAD